MRKIFVFLLCLIVIFAIGCNTEIQSQADAQTDASSKSTEQETPANTDTAIDVEADAKVNVPAGKSLSDILGSKIVQYTADYTIETQGNQMTFTMAINLPKIAYHMKLPEGETKMIMDGQKINSCTKTDSTWQCLAIDAPTPLASEDLEKNIARGEVQTTLVGSCSIAGETGNKYKTEGKDHEGTVCYTSDGILLEMETMRPQPSTMRATYVSRTAAASSFELPAESKDIGAMIPEGIMIPQN